MYLSPDSTIKASANLRKLFSEQVRTRSSVSRLVIRVLPTGAKNSLFTISQLQGMRIADIPSPVTAPVNINHHLLSPGVLAADVEHVAAIVVTVAGQQLNMGRHL